MFVSVFLVNRLRMPESEVRNVIRKKINDENTIVVRAAKKRTAVPDAAEPRVHDDPPTM